MRILIKESIRRRRKKKKDEEDLDDSFVFLSVMLPPSMEFVKMLECRLYGTSV